MCRTVIVVVVMVVVVGVIIRNITTMCIGSTLRMNQIIDTTMTVVGYGGCGCRHRLCTAILFSNGRVVHSL